MRLAAGRPAVAAPAWLASHPVCRRGILHLIWCWIKHDTSCTAPVGVTFAEFTSRLRRFQPHLVTALLAPESGWDDRERHRCSRHGCLDGRRKPSERRRAPSKRPDDHSNNVSARAPDDHSDGTSARAGDAVRQTDDDSPRLRRRYCPDHGTALARPSSRPRPVSGVEPLPVASWESLELIWANSFVISCFPRVCVDPNTGRAAANWCSDICFF